MLKLGEKIIKSLYLGDKAIAKVFLGAKLIYQKISAQPIFLEYIITDGNSYIDTEYCPNENTYIEYTFEIVKAPPQAWNGLFGSRQDTAYYAYNIFCRNSLNLRLDYGRYAEVSYQTSLNTKYTMKAGLGEIYINDELVKSYTPQTQGTSPYSMYLGNFNNKGTPYTTGTPQRIYPCPIYENGVLVRDFKPCIAPNGQVAMYDEVNKKYHYNQGTGTLKPSGRFVESILFDGACVVDTGIPHQTCTVECDIRFEETGTRQLMGFGTGSGQYWGAGATGIFDYMNGTNALDRTDVVIDFNAEELNYTIYADGKSRTSANGNALSSLTYRIGAGPTGVSSNAYWCTCEVWSNKITNAEGVLIQDLRPYVDSDGVACFKDLVTGDLFYNKGTGTLTANGEMQFVESIVFDGNSYIDTGYKPNSNSSVKVVYKPYYNTVFSCIMGTQDTTTTNRFYALISSTLYKIQLNSMASSTSYFGINETGLPGGGNGTFAENPYKTGLTIDNYNKIVKVESPELTKPLTMGNGNALAGDPSCNYSLLLGDRGTAGVPSGANAYKGEIYGLEIKEENVLVHDFKPCILGSTPCFYDKVTGKIFTNSGKGTLGYIKEPEKITGHTEIDYLQGQYNSYINTGVLGQQGLKIEIDVWFPKLYSRECYILGCDDGTNKFYAPYLYSGGYFAFRLGTSGTRYGTAIKAGTWYNVVIDTQIDEVNNPGVYATMDVDGVRRVTYKQSKLNEIINYPIYLFGHNSAGTALIGVQDPTAGSHDKTPNYYKTCIKACKMWLNGELIRDFIPVQKSDGYKCMYDKLEGKYYEFQQA